jgi:transcriptional regulator with XRE-family HTH domain
MEIGIALRKLRLKHNYSQQYVANFCEISRNAYADWERDKVNLSVKQCLKLCRLYNVAFSKFIADYIENDESCRERFTHEYLKSNPDYRSQ